MLLFSVCYKAESSPECNVTHMLGCFAPVTYRNISGSEYFLSVVEKISQAHNVCIMSRFSGAEILPPSTLCEPS